MQSYTFPLTYLLQKMLSCSLIKAAALSSAFATFLSISSFFGFTNLEIDGVDLAVLIL